jgi:AAA15 family ATPase/GTPase
MSEHFIKNIEIKNFKCFEDFKAEGFGRVNLIGGKNNVGKTALIEALFTNIYSINLGYFVVAIAQLKNRRNILENLDSYIYGDSMTFKEKFIIEPLKNSQIFNVKTDIRETRFVCENKNGIIEYLFEIDKQQFTFNLESIPYIRGTGNKIFISTDGLTNRNIVTYYASVQKEDKEEFLNKSLQIIDSSISKFKILEDKPYCKVNEEYIQLTELGDGVKHFISIILALYQAKDGYLFIDEIGNGIHHSTLDKLWNVILTLAKEQNVQVFATTHSDECIRALVTANTENIKTYQPKEHILEDNEIQFIELGRVDGKVDSIIFDFKELENEVAQNMEIRGW